MIRHPLWLAVEALTAVLLTALGHLGLQRPAPAPPELRFALSALGERERPDGSWQGVDLLRDPGASVDRFQLSVRAEVDAQLTVDAVTPDGRAMRIFPGAGSDGVLFAGVGYALPGPASFYGLDGDTRLRVALRPLDAKVEPGPVSALPGAVDRPYPLSDGSRAWSTERAYRAPQGGTLELPLRHQG